MLKNIRLFIEDIFFYRYLFCKCLPGTPVLYASTTGLISLATWKNTLMAQSVLNEIVVLCVMLSIKNITVYIVWEMGLTSAAHGKKPQMDPAILLTICLFVPHCNIYPLIQAAFKRVKGELHCSAYMITKNFCLSREQTLFEQCNKFNKSSTACSLSLIHKYPLACLTILLDFSDVELFLEIFSYVFRQNVKHFLSYTVLWNVF